MSDPSCISSALASLDLEVLQALSGVINTAKAALETLKLTKQGMQLSIDVLVSPLQLVAGTLNGLVNEARASAQIVPQDLISLCPDLGKINTKIEDAISPSLQAVTDKLDYINRLLSEKAQLGDSIDQIDQGIDYFENLLDQLNAVIALK